MTGYVELYAPDAGVTASATDPRIVRRVSREEVASKVPYPVAPYYLVATGGPISRTHPVRREIPVLDDGPHRSYAVQWFFFAAIALGGAGAVVWRERREGRAGRRAPRGDP
jgi:cytochrome oxidase assembly protein ShyY1